MASRYLSAYIETQKPPEQLRESAIEVFRSVGGLVLKTREGFQITGGTYGISVSFTAKLNANIVFKKIKENTYEVQVFLNWSWEFIMWAMVVLGLLMGGLPWLLLFLYLFFDPVPVYSQALNRFITLENITRP